MPIARAQLAATALAAAGFTAATLSPHGALAFTLDEAQDRYGQSHAPLELRAYDRAVSAFNANKKKKSKHRYKWAGKKAISLEYERPVKLMRRDMLMEFKVPGKNGTWMRFRLKF